MFSAMEVFTSCSANALHHASEAEHEHLSKWLKNEVYPIVPCFSLRPDSVSTLLDAVFKDTVVRDFCLTLTTRFFALCCEGEQFTIRLAASLSNGLAVDGPDTKLSIVPNVIKDSMPQSIFSLHFKNTTPVKFLESNKVFMVLLMLHLTHAPPSAN
jgi:hypothetical protein